MKIGRFRLFGFCGIGLMSICGSALGMKLGSNGFDQWMIFGFALGILFSSQLGLGPVADKIAELEGRIAALQKD